MINVLLKYSSQCIHTAKGGKIGKIQPTKKAKDVREKMTIQLNIKEVFGLLLHVTSWLQILFFVHCFFIHIQSFTYQKYVYLAPTVLHAWCRGYRE